MSKMAMENVPHNGSDDQSSVKCRLSGNSANVGPEDKKDHQKICEQKTTTIPTATVTKPCQPLVEKNGREIGVLLMLLFGFLLLVMVAPINSFIS